MCHCYSYSVIFKQGSQDFSIPFQAHFTQIQGPNMPQLRHRSRLFTVKTTLRVFIIRTSRLYLCELVLYELLCYRDGWLCVIVLLFQTKSSIAAIPAGLCGDLKVWQMWQMHIKSSWQGCSALLALINQSPSWPLQGDVGLRSSKSWLCFSFSAAACFCNPLQSTNTLNARIICSPQIQIFKDFKAPWDPRLNSQISCT